ncbi:MAG TPA: mechanosensitive ion channel family protein [Verrucomicrobiae bacterium]|nr:mechanosensitive ion channel family protein [Verrucomicrobiae bacterium]
MNPDIQTRASEWLHAHGVPVLVIVVGAFILLLLATVIARKVGQFAGRKAADPEHAALASTLSGVVRWLLCIAILAAALFLLLGQFGVNVGPVLDVAWGWFLTNGVRIVLIVAATLVLLKVATILTKKLTNLLSRKEGGIEYEKRAGTLSGVVHWVLRLVILAVATIMVMKEFGVDVAPVIAAAGVVGLAVGFGAQNLVADFITGFFILLEDQVRVGDVVSIGDKGGFVERVTLRMVILRGLDGSVHFIRNGKIDVVTNMTKEFSHYVITIGVAYRENVDEVIKVLQSIDEEMRQDPAFKDDILAPLEVLGLDSFGDSSVNIKARTKTKPIQQWRIGREFNRRIKNKFDELNIEIPFPHQTIYFGKDKAGKSPAVNVEMARTA